MVFPCDGPGSTEDGDDVPCPGDGWTVTGVVADGRGRVIVMMMEVDDG